MALSFKDYLREESSVAYFTFGRMNPPTIGHEKLLDQLKKNAGKNPYFVFLSQTQDKKKNPLDYSSKVKHVRKMFPSHSRRIMINKKVRTPFDAATSLFDQGYKSIVMVVGSDRVREFETLMNKYNGEKGRHGFFNFKSIQVVSAGARDPDAEGVEGMSASKLRAFAMDNKFSEFSQGLGGLSNKDAKKLFTDVRSGMGIKEESVFARHIKLNSVSEQREKFVKGELFQIGDVVVIKESGETATITNLGSNYIDVITESEKVMRKWLDGVEKLEEACWKGYTQKGLKKKGDKMVPNCVPESVPSSQEFIPSPTGGRRSSTLKAEDQITPPSKALQIRKRRVQNERVSSVDATKERIKREKQQNRGKYDRMLDRARLADVRAKNKTTK